MRNPFVGQGLDRRQARRARRRAALSTEGHLLLEVFYRRKYMTREMKRDLEAARALGVTDERSEG